MNALNEAKKFMADAHDESEKDIEYAQVAASITQAYAAIALAEATERQASALERIADALERYIGPAAPTNPERDDYIKNSVPGESLAEYQQRR